MTKAFEKRVTVALTGASGMPYGMRLIQCLVHQKVQVFVLISKAAQVVLATETDYQMPGTPEAQQGYLSELFGAEQGQLHVFGREQWFAPVASGSGAPGAMVVCPCSTGTLSAIAIGASNNLIERAADVALKERRQLILVPRETPFSEIHLTNMLSLTKMGAVILPAAPGFYHQPECIQDLIDFIVARILMQLGMSQDLMPLWGEELLKSKG